MHVNHELILAEVGRGRALSRNHTNVMSSPWPKKNVLFVATVKKQNSKQSFEIKFTNQQKFRLQTGRDLRDRLEKVRGNNSLTDFRSFLYEANSNFFPILFCQLLQSDCCR